MYSIGENVRSVIFVETTKNLNIRMTARMIVETTPTKKVIVAHRDVDLSLTDRRPRSGFRTSSRHQRTPAGRCGSTDTRAPPWWSHLSIETEQ